MPINHILNLKKYFVANNYFLLIIASIDQLTIKAGKCFKHLCLRKLLIWPINQNFQLQFCPNDYVDDEVNII